ncbi:zinc finger BED domain-containing protein DAYSLEEPER-like [Brassica napus]|uniref:zinc finger BED domain-containing protein DAYSLEEPER-like n=2 Tax=Brassica TaxID=3705 RepID=UPI00207A4F16|nr:zinc finger BED domain-containing protein DAYSLEEPER-like [Brassica napus]
MGLCKSRYCGQEIGCDTKKSGTSTMKNHIARFKFFKAFEESGSQHGLGIDSSGVVTAVMYDDGLFRRSVNEMIVLNELPFSFVESEGFRKFCHNVLPMYSVHCRRTIIEDILGMFMKDNSSLKPLFSSEKKRVSLTTDIWTAPTTSYNYMKRIINFKLVTHHKGDTIAEHLSQCLADWEIEKVFTVTMDNVKGNDKELRLFTKACRQLRPNALIKDVRDGLAEVKESVVAIRNDVKYVRSSGTWLQSFQLRVLTRKFRVAFEKLLSENMLYNDYFKESEENGHKRVGPPTAHRRDEVHRFVKFLKLFFGSTLAFSESKTVTSTSCYNEVVIIERNLIALRNSRDDLLRLQATDMRTKFEKYWDGLINMNPLVIIASIFDPRNKMQFASICCDKIYGKDSVESAHLRTSIRALMKQLYEEYVVKIGPLVRKYAPPNITVHAVTVQHKNVFFDLQSPT